MNFARSLLSRRFRLLMTAALFVLGTVPVASVPARADDETAATYCSDGRAQLDQARHFSNQSDPDMWDSAALLRAGKDFGECIHQADDHDLVTAGAAGVVITEIEIAQHFGTLAYEVRGLNGDTALSHKWFDKWRHLALQSLHNVAEFIPIIRKRGGFNRVMEQDAQFAHYFSTIMEGMTFETTPKTADVLFAHIKNITWYAKRISGTPEAPAATAGAPKPAPTETPDATIGEEQDFISNFLSQPGHQVVSDAHVLGGDPYTVTLRGR